jgi:hypothetical protein
MLIGLVAPRDLERAANLRFGHPGVGTPSKIDPMTIASAAKPGAAGRHAPIQRRC